LFKAVRQAPEILKKLAFAGFFCCSMVRRHPALFVGIQWICWYFGWHIEGNAQFRPTKIPTNAPNRYADQRVTPGAKPDQVQ
jgi:hypothetical protein